MVSDFPHVHLQNRKRLGLLIAENKMASKSGVVAESANKFALDLYQCLRNDGILANENLFYSPASLLIALAMTSYGAKGETAEEIMKVLHLASITKSDLNNNMKQFISTLNAASDNNTKLLTANKLFIEKSFEILETFKEGTREFYDAEVALVDYKAHAERVREEINQWVEQKTNDKIKGLIPAGMLSEDTRLTLVNAIYFKGLWLEAFRKGETVHRPFFVPENENIQVPMMYREADFKCLYSKELACQILEMLYIGLKMSMVIFLPEKTHGLASLEEKMTFDNLQKSLSALDASKPHQRGVCFPKFKLTQQFDLSDMLSRMGASEMFIRGKANFTGIATEPLFVSHLVHKAFVEVNEEGTEAAAATGIMVDYANLTPVFNANHPFLFLIRHNDTGAILFLGRLKKPSHEA